MIKLKNLKLKNKLYIWCCDSSHNSGEGILANKFINDLKSISKNYKFITKSPNKYIKYSKSNFVNRFIYPSIGLLYLWYIFFFKRKKKICYVNYLPLWNFLLFLLLPPKTILGPITGGSKYLDRPIMNYIIRHYLFRFLYSVSLLILNLRHKKILFSTDLLKSFTKKSKNYYFNYILKNINFLYTKGKKKYDLVFYLRNHNNKNSELQTKIASYLSQKFNIVTVGEKINNTKIKNFGFVKRSKLFKILKKTKYSFISSENLYSFFAIDSFENNCYLIYFKDKFNKKSILPNSYGSNYNNFSNIVKFIEKKILQYKSPPKINIKIKNINDYFDFDL